MWDTLKNEETIASLSRKDFKQFIESTDKILGLKLVDSLVLEEVKEIPSDIQQLFDARTIARNEKNWTEADKLREEIKGKGYEVID